MLGQGSLAAVGRASNLPGCPMTPANSQCLSLARAVQVLFILTPASPTPRPHPPAPTNQHNKPLTNTNTIQPTQPTSANPGIRPAGSAMATAEKTASKGTLPEQEAGSARQGVFSGYLPHSSTTGSQAGLALACCAPFALQLAGGQQKGPVRPGAKQPLLQQCAERRLAPCRRGAQLPTCQRRCAFSATTATAKVP
jgi:septal ring-binding cell division protein DamX